MRFYIVRHGDPDYPRDDLTPAGHREARALGELFGHSRLDEIHSSPLGRARLTADYTAKAAALPVTVQDWSRELSLKDEESGLMAWDYDPGLFATMDRGEKGRALVEDRWRSLHPFDHPDLGPSLERLEKGADEFMAGQGYVREKGGYRITAENRRRVALFCHNGSGLALLAHLLGLPTPAVWGAFYFHTSSVTTLLFEERRPGLATVRCIGLSDLSHLRKAGIEAGTSGLKANFD